MLRFLSGRSPVQFQKWPKLPTLESAEGLIEDFAALKDSEKLDLLLEFSESLPELPERYADHPELLERVEECQSPIFLFVEIDDAGLVRLFLVPPLSLQQREDLRAFSLASLMG